MDEQDGQRHAWEPPTTPPWATGAPVAQADEPDADGPPPPPWVTRRRRRRRTLGVIAVVVLLVAVPVGLLWAGVFDGGDPTANPAEDADTAAPDDGPDADGTFEAPDPADYSGSDADFAAVLRSAEASEQVMLRFQADLAEAFALGGPDDLDPFYAAVRSAAATGAADLAEVRPTLEDEVRTDAADEVRQVYLGHLDAWLALMEATEGDPSLFGPVGDTSRFDVDINATALDFARTLEASLPEDADPEIAGFVDQLLDRGFRFDNEAQV